MIPTVHPHFKVSYWEVAKNELRNRSLKQKLALILGLMILALVINNGYIQIALSILTLFFAACVHFALYMKKTKYEETAISAHFADERAKLEQIAMDLRECLDSGSKEKAIQLLKQLSHWMARSLAKGLPKKQAMEMSNFHLRFHEFSWNIDTASHPWQVLTLKCRFKNQYPYIEASGRILL